MRRSGKIFAITAATLLLATATAGCGSSSALQEPVSETAADSDSEERNIVIGFSQLGAESDWRNAHTESILHAFSEEDGYTLIYKNGQQKQSNQITAIRTFIQQEVDYIILAPSMETGWESVLEEAREAGIPVILVDRRVDVADRGLFACWVGSDFELEGKKMAAWIEQYARAKGVAARNIRIAHIQGTVGSSAQIGRTRALANAARNTGWDILAQMDGDFTQTKGHEVMAAFLKRFEKDISVAYCENDNEAIGALEAIDEAGYTAGSDIKNGDIMVVSFDGVNKDAIEYALEGRISCLAECNPLHGPRVRDLIESLERGETPDQFNYVDERIFSSLPEVREITVDGVTYPVEMPEKGLYE